MIAEKAGITQWAILFGRITELTGLSPWQRFGADKPVLLQLPGRRDVVYAVFSQEGERRSLDFCPGDDALLDRELLQGLQPEEAGELRFCQRFLSVRLGEQPGMTGEDYELIARMAPAYRGEEWFVWFRSFEPGYAPAALSRREVALLCDLTEQLCQALRDCETGLAVPDPELPEILARRWEERRGWVSEITVLHPIRRRPEPLRVTDELLPARTLRRPVVDAKLELDSFYIPQLIADEAWPKPYYPRVLLLADSGSGQVAGYEMLTPGDSLRERLAALIEAFLESYGRPLVFYLSDPTLCALLGEYLDRLFLPWREVAFLPAVNRFKLTRGISELSGGSGNGE
jgi:hypothetical protein